MVDSSLRTGDTPLDDCEHKECKLPRKHEGRCDVHSPILIIYTNWKGSKRKRRLSPTGQTFFEGNEWHKIPTWLFECIDHDDGKVKRFAFIGIDAAYRQVVAIAIATRWGGG